MKRIAFGFALGVIFVFVLNEQRYMREQDRKKKAHEVLSAFKWNDRIDWDAFDERLADS